MHMSKGGASDGAEVSNLHAWKSGNGTTLLRSRKSRLGKGRDNGSGDNEPSLADLQSEMLRNKKYVPVKGERKRWNSSAKQ